MLEESPRRFECEGPRTTQIVADRNGLNQRRSGGRRRREDVVTCFEAVILFQQQTCVAVVAATNPLSQKNCREIEVTFAWRNLRCD